jgi:hypothetical protein
MLNRHSEAEALAPDPSSGFRGTLQGILGALASSYGFTLTIWSTGAVVAHRRGIPDLPGVVLLIAGAALAFTAVQAWAYGTLRPSARPFVAPPVGVWVSAQALPAALPVTISWLVARVVSGDLVWLAAGAIATGGYVMLASVQASWLIGARSA